MATVTAMDEVGATSPHRAIFCQALALSALSWACSGPPSVLVEGRDATADDAGNTGDGLPNLTIDVDRVSRDLAIEERIYDETACELTPEEDCIGAPGARRLLRFSVETPNTGDADLVIGAPESPLFEYSLCHGHHHFSGFASYQLIDAQGGQVATGHKQAFCLVDTHAYIDSAETPTTRRFNCNFQGIQRGWSDVYDSGLACQFIDITDVPDGAYTLRVHINTEDNLVESNYADNVVEVPVTLGDSTLETPTEACPADGGRAHDEITRECGWSLGGVYSCTPGQSLRVGCADNCALGACTGDPMLRVCASGRPDGNCSHGASIGRGNDACGTTCPQATNVTCPPGGSIDVYVTSRDPTQSFTCDIAVQSI